MVLRLRFAFLALFLALPALLRAQEAPPSQEISIPVNLWPLIYQEKGPQRTQTEVLFSLFYYERDHHKLSLAVRPIYSTMSDPDKGLREWSVLWPLARYSREKDVRSLNIFPLFWQRLSPPESRSLFVPFYSYNRDEKLRKLGIIGYSPWSLFDFRKNYETGAVVDRYLIVTYARQGPVTNFSIAPLFNQTNAPDEGSSALFPVYYYAWNRPEGFMHFSMLGLPDHFNVFERWRDDREHLREWHFLNVYDRQDSSGTVHVVAPVYWRILTPSQDTLQVWPFYGRSLRGSYEEYSTVWPFFRYGSSPGGESNLNLLWPLIARERRPDMDHDRVLPLFSWTRRARPGEQSGWTTAGLVSPLPLYMHSASPDYSYDRFFWLAWLTRNGDVRRDVVLDFYNFDFPSEGVQHRGVFPFWHRSLWPGHKVEFVAPAWFVYKQEGLSFKTFFPLYWDYRTPQADIQTAVPLYLKYRSGGYTLTTFFPLYYHSYDKELDAELNYYFPLYGTYRRGDYLSRHLIFFPLWSHLRDDGAGLDSWDLLWPFFHYETSPQRGSVRVLPFYWQSRSPEGSFAVGFPLFWQFASSTTSQTHVIPFYGAYRQGAFSLHYVLGPLYVRMEDKDYSRIDVLGSLYSRRSWAGTESSHFFPLYWASSSSEFARRELYPFGGYERAAPSYRSLYLLGLSKTLSLFDFESDPATDYRLTRVLNFYSRSDRASYFRTFFPLYWASGDGSRRESMLVPFFARQEDRGERSSDFCLLGLPEGLSLVELYRNEEADQDSQRILLYYHKRSRERHLKTVFPLYWAWWEPKAEHSLFFPLYAARSDEGGTGLGLIGATPDWSLFSYRRDAGGASSRLFPFYGWRRQGEARELSLLGFWHRASLFYLEKKPDALRHRFFPVYSYERRGEEAQPGYSVETSVLWRLVYYEREGDKTDLRLVYRLLRVSREPGGSAFELNPLYFRISKNGASYWAVLGGLFGVETRADGGRRFRYLWFF